MDFQVIGIFHNVIGFAMDNQIHELKLKDIHISIINKIMKDNNIKGVGHQTKFQKLMTLMKYDKIDLLVN